MTDTNQVTPYTQDGHIMADYSFSWVDDDETTEITWGFLSAITPEYPYQRKIIPASERQIAVGDTVGETTLDAWWHRSQASWHLGTNKEWMDGGNNPNDSYRFKDSCSVEVSAEGQVSLLREVESIDKGFLDQGDYDAATDTPGLDTNISDMVRVNAGDLYTVSVGGDFFSTPVTVGQHLFAKKDSPMGVGDWQIISSGGQVGTNQAMETVWTGPDNSEKGVLFSVGGDLRFYDADGNETPIVTNATNSAKMIEDIASDGSQWFIADKNEIIVGDLPSDSGAIWWDTDNTSGSFGVAGSNRDMVLLYAKERLFVMGGEQTSNRAWFFELSGLDPRLPEGGPPAIDLDFTEGANAEERDSNGSIIPESGVTTTGGNGGSYRQGMTWAHPAPNWLWFDACDGPGRIYLAGYAGDRSAIYAATYDPSTAPAIGTPFEILQLPRGEQIRSVNCYLGTHLIVGTTAGVRICLIDETGAVQLAPPSVDMDNTGGCWSVTGHGSFIIAGGGQATYVGTPGDDSADVASTSHSLVKIDLNQPILNEFGGQTGKFAYANYAMPAAGAGVSTRSAKNVAMIGDTGRVAFNVVGTVAYPEGLYFEKESTRVDKGWLETGKIRMDTWEQKVFQWLKTFFSTVDGQIVIQYKTDRDTNWQTLASPVTDAARGWEGWGSDGHPATYIQYRFVLYRGDGDPTSTPVLTGWQVQSNPSNVGEVELKIPLLFTKDQAPFITQGNMRKNWDTWDAIQDLENAVRLGVLTKMTNHGTGETIWGQVRDAQFVQLDPAKSRQGQTYPSGLMYVTFRAVTTS